MAYTQADLDALDEEIKAVQTVSATAFADQSTTFRPLAELLELRRVMQQQVNGSRKTRYAATSKGC